MKLLERTGPKKGAAKPMVRPTPIRISKRTAIVLALTIVATLVLVLWAVPSALTSAVSLYLRMRSSQAVRTPKAVWAKLALLMASGSPSSPGAYT